MPAKRMTANPLKPTRYRPGKGPEDEASPEESGDSQAEGEISRPSPPPQSAPPPKATTFPAANIASNLKAVDLNARRAQASAAEAARLKAEKIARAVEEEGFETESSDSEEDSEEQESESEEESSDEEAPKVLLRPTFIRKDKRKDVVAVLDSKTEEERWMESEERRKEKADELVQAQLEKNAAARAAGKKNWDDDEEVDGEEVDDTDDLDPEAERAAWKLRELKRVKREREVIELAEKEREEIERRRNLSKEERDEEDREFIEQQKEEQEGKGKMGYLQKYFHKGAFFQDDAKAEGLDRRDIMGSRYADDVTNRELLPQYMQIRDMTKLGRKGRTKYKDLKSEDTGKWGAFEGKGSRRDGVDERFMPDRNEGAGGASGANATQVRERGRAPETAPDNARVSTDPVREDSRDGGGSYKPDRDRQDYDERRRPRSYSRSRSPSPRRQRRRDSRDRRKRSPSPYKSRWDEKRRRVDV
ncbi:hypothetical protein MMC13_003454 [Lambiella insularis]|nr:hypothetical protein [Lambiella insularis]